MITLMNKSSQLISQTTLFITALAQLLLLVSGQCPWSRELVDLHTDCVCAYSNNQRLSIQCSPVNFTKLMDTLRSSVKGIPIDLLYVNNSTVEILGNNTFEDLHVQSLHVSRSKIREIDDEAFAGLEESLTSLNLQDNLLRGIPDGAIKRLTSLQLLDLSQNHIKDVPDDVFKGLPLTTLKLSDNQVNISDGAFFGLEGSLKNLNLQAAGLTRLPKAIQKLRALAFVDLAQNKIEEVESAFMSEMQSLTALNLERNRISKLDEKTFQGVNATLSSLSLLNNALDVYPIDALSVLTEVRVLDLGFNRITDLPNDAFKNNKYLTLLALDGNPFTTISKDAFMHLNSSLRGLSIGGSSLTCDCRIRWVAEWMRDKGLQVTSRERNPQFCGQPEHLRRRSFLQLLPLDFRCPNDTTSYSRATKGPKRLDDDFDSRPGASNIVRSESAEVDTKLQILTLGTDTSISDLSAGLSTDSPQKSGISRVSRKDQTSAIRIKHAFKRDSTLVIEWDSKETPKGYQVLIRVFGHRDFKRIMPIPRDKRKIHIENLPLNQCLVVCVIDYEEVSNIQVEHIPMKQCRELKGDDSRIISLDKIVICASAIICVIVIIGALIIILFYLRRKDPRDTTAIIAATPMPGAMPIIKTETEWETLSWNSGRSTPKPPPQHCIANGTFLGKPGSSTTHSFVLSDAHMQHKSLPYPKLATTNGFLPSSYSTHDNESRISYSHASKIGGILVRPADIQRSKSLTRPAGYHPYGNGGNFIRKKKHNNNNRANGRLASASSAQSSTECESDWNGRSVWKDDADIYVSQNHVLSSNKKQSMRRVQ